jgi:hypothetical protein
MRLLSKTAENTLISAIERAAGLVNDGMAPNDAIVKSATESAIPPGHLDLMVHAYNTGRTTKQREAGENTLEKAADFTLADVDAIRATLYPATVKTSAELVQNDAVSTEYALNPASFIKRHTKEASRGEYVKQAYAPTWTPPPRDEQAAAARAYSEKHAARLAMEESRRVVTAAYSKAAATFDALATYFRTPGHESFADVLADAALTHGEHGVAALNKLAAVYPQFAKEAATNARMMGDSTPRKLLGEVLDAVDAYNTLNAAYTKIAEAAKPAPQPTVETYTGSVLSALSDAPVILKSADAPKVENFFNDKGREYKAQWNDAKGTWDQIGGLKPTPPAPKKPALENTSVSLENMMSPAKFIGEQMGMSESKIPDPMAAGKKQYNSIDDPDQNAAIKSIRAKSVLHDLILNDPVISGHDPQDVAMAFNDISELAPNLVETPGMLQTVLRKRLESGQLADFDVKQILEMDKLRAERDKIQGESRRINMESM